MPVSGPVATAAPAEPPAKSQPKEPRHRRSPRIHLPRRTRKERALPEPEAVVDHDADHPFVYLACATCHAKDWIVRTTRNEDGTWNYWCVRCSRAFKTETKLRNALKPFLSAGIVVGGVTAASMLMLR